MDAHDMTDMQTGPGPIPDDYKTYKTYMGEVTGRKYYTYDKEFASMTQEDIANYVPEQTMVEVHPKTLKVLSAAQVMRRRRDKELAMVPRRYANPMQTLDHRILESLSKSTFIGALIDAFTKYLIGNGFKPELELNNPDDDEETNLKDIASNQDIITNLLEIDHQTDVDPNGHIDATFKQKVAAIVSSTVTYQRGALMHVYDPEHPITINGKPYPQIPTSLVYAHARELGMIETDPKTNRLKAVGWQYEPSHMRGVEDMIYLWNPLVTAKVNNAWHYGVSMLGPLISASKLIRSLLSDTFPKIAKTTWAGLWILSVKNEGQTPEAKREEYDELKKGATPGAPNILLKDPNHTRTDQIDYKPVVNELQQLMESMIKLCISVMGLPQVGFYDESAANRATMVGKIQLTMRTTIEPMREWIGEALVNQWYNRWFQILYEDQPEILEKFKIRVSWENLNISEWYDNVEAALAAETRKAFKDTAFGELAGFDNYESMIDPDADTNPGGQPKPEDMAKLGFGQTGMNPNGPQPPNAPGGRMGGPAKPKAGGKEKIKNNFGDK